MIKLIGNHITKPKKYLEKNVTIYETNRMFDYRITPSRL